MREPRKIWRRHIVRPPEAPLGWTAPSRSACLGLFLATRDEAADGARPFRDRERVLEALGRGILAVDETIRVDGRITTVGRFLVSACFPPVCRLEIEARPLTASRLTALLSRVTRDEHVEVAGRVAEALELFGRWVADRSGLSLARHDFDGPSQRDAIVASALALVRGFLDGDAGRITDFDRYRRTVDVWSSATYQIRRAARAEAAPRDPLAALAAAEEESSPPEQVRAMGGVLQGSPWMGPWELPVLHTPREGLTAHEYMMTCRAARRATLEQRTKDGVTAALLHDLHVVLEETAITVSDCGTSRGVRVVALDGSATLASRTEGRVAAADIVSPEGMVLAKARTLITRLIAERIEAGLVPSVVLLDPLTCDADGGVCTACFGLDPVDATWPCIRDEVGARAAITIARAARTMTTHYFHVC